MLDNDDTVSRRSVLKGAGAGLAATTVGMSSAGATPEEHLVGIDPQAKGRGTAAAKRAADNVRKTIDFGDVGRTVVGEFSAQARKGLENNPNIEYVESNGTAHKLGEKLPVGIDRVDADVLHSEGTTGSGATVAILDTGVDDDHPDLGANVDPSLGAAFETSCGAENGGCRFGAEGYNGNDCNYEWSDDDDHGSHVAGSADAVRGNNEGLAGGVSTEATIMPVKVLTGCGSGSFSAIADGVKYAADNGADVINMSLGADSGNSTLKNACQYAYDNGVVLVASAGNSGPCTDCVGFPAAYSTVIAVSAVDPRDDTLADFSSTGSEVELAAPGVDTLSTIPPESDDGSTYETGYETFSGTSMSAPHVAGGAGQVVANSSLSNKEVRKQLKDSAEDIGLGSNESGAGLLDAEAAVDSLGGSTDTAPSASWVNPTGGDTVSGTVTVQIDASDSEDSDDSLDVTYTVDGGSARSTSYNSTSGYYEDSWDTTTVSDGDHTLEATVTDSAGNTTTSSITVTTDNSTESALAVSTGDATSVGTDAATLNGSLDDLGGADSADVYFEWGPSGDLSNTTSTQTLSSTGSFSADISGLSSDTTYDFRAVASASDGDGDTGSTNSFTTDTESTSTAPTVDSHTVSTRTTGPWNRVTADWAVSDDDGDLSSVDVEIRDSSGSTLNSTTVSVSGSSASGSDELKTRGTPSESVVIVTDSKGNSDTSSKSV
jgi:subtilisin family serine protease